MKPLLAAAVLCSFSASAHAAYLTAVRPLEGYECAKLNATEKQMLNPSGSGIYLFSEPSPTAARGLLAPSVLLVRKPAHVVNGFAEVIQFNGQPAWIAVSNLKPMDSAARCVPSVMSNGKLGIG